MKTLSVEFASGDLTLEGELHLPDTTGRSAVVTLCHAHSLYGGSMDSNVLDAIVNCLMPLRVASLKFNFRGVGRSQGSFGWGTEEQKDLKAALDFLSTRPEIDATRIGVAGYSFGGMVAFPVALADTRVKALALVSPAVPASDLVKLKDWERPALIISGARDDLVPAGKLAALRQRIGNKPEIQIVAEADHFWSGAEPGMAAKVADFLKLNLHGATAPLLATPPKS